MSKIYIAGKITGNPNFKEEFEAIEKELISKNEKVMNPANLGAGFTQQEYLHICMAIIDVCDVVMFLPSWEDSKGAHFEMGYATAKGKEIEYY